MKEEKKEQRSGQIPEQKPSKAMDSKREVEQSPDEKTDQDFPGYPHYPAKEDIMDQRTGMHRVDMDVENLPRSNNKTGVNQRFPANTGENKEAQEPASDDDYRDLNQRPEATSQNMKVLHNADTDTGRISDTGTAAENRRRFGTEPTDDTIHSDPDGAYDVTPIEQMVLENAGLLTQDEENLHRSALDNTDFEGDELNEDSFGEVFTGADLDVPDDTEEATQTTALGQGDEENSYYSLGSIHNDNLNEGMDERDDYKDISDSEVEANNG